MINCLIMLFEQLNNYLQIIQMTIYHILSLQQFPAICLLDHYFPKRAIQQFSAKFPNDNLLYMVKSPILCNMLTCSLLF